MRPFALAIAPDSKAHWRSIMSNLAQRVIGVVAAFVLSGLSFAATLA